MLQENHVERTRRQKAILDLVAARPIGTQAELKALLERQGISATQSSLSRDLDELGVVKSRGAYALPEARERSGRAGLLELRLAGDALVVARCLPGLAPAVAAEIDRAGVPGVAGTVAGDDTVFIAVEDRGAQRSALKALWSLFEIAPAP